MLKCVKETDCYKSLNLSNNLSHAYLFYSLDNLLNKEVALTKANEILCEHKNACGKCAGCVQFASQTHPDLTIIEQDSVKVEDVEKLQSKLSTKPVFADNRVFVILNAEVINETAQNKLLKSFEEPNDSTIFILTTTRLNKLLPTVASRLNKVFVPALSFRDKELVANELKEKNIDISANLRADFNLTESVNLATNNVYTNTISLVFSVLDRLNTTADIPSIVSNLNVEDKSLFFVCLSDIFLDTISCKKFEKTRIDKVKEKFNEKAVIKILPLIDEAYKYLNSNVNFTYILDNLLFNILKEKFLCK